VSNRWRWKGILVGICAVAVLVSVILFQSVMMVRVEPIVYAPPPVFDAAGDGESIGEVAETEPARTVETVGLEDEAGAVWDEDGSALAEAEYRLGNLDDASSPLEYVALMKDDDPAIRLEALKRFVHPEVRQKFGFVHPEWREEFGMDDSEFWDLLEEDKTAIKALFYEGLVHSVNSESDDSEQFAISLMHTIGAMPWLDDESYEMLAWVSDNHPSSEARDYAMYHVTAHVPGSAVALELVKNRRSDPDPWVRWHALGYQFEMMGTGFISE